VRTEASLDTVTLDLQYVDEESGISQSGVYLWPGSFSLNEYIIDNWRVLPHERVIELGAGIGSTGLVCRTLQADEKGAVVVITDREDQILRVVDENAARNHLSIGTCRLDWGDSPDGVSSLQSLRKKFGSQGFSLIVGSECYYDLSRIGELFWTASRLLRDDKAVFVTCSSLPRDNAAFAEFDRVCKRVGLTRTLISNSFNGKEQSGLSLYQRKGIIIESYQLDLSASSYAWQYFV